MSNNESTPEKLAEGYLNIIEECHNWMDQSGFQKIDDLLKDGQVVGQMEIPLDDRVYYMSKEWKQLKEENEILNKLVARHFDGECLTCREGDFCGHKDLLNKLAAIQTPMKTITPAQEKALTSLTQEAQVMGLYDAPARKCGLCERINTHRVDDKCPGGDWKDL